MRLVVTVERYAPAIGGAERVVQRLSEGLASRGHEVHVITGGPRRDELRQGVSVHRFPISGNLVRGIRGDGASILGFILGLEPDVVLNYAAQAWSTDVCFPLLDNPLGPLMVLAPCGFSGLRHRRYRAYFAQMPARMRSYDALIFHSSVYQDWHFAVEAGVERCVVIPNGADPPISGDELRRQFAGGRVAVTVGSHVHSKGHREFVRATNALSKERELVSLIVAPRRRGLDAMRGCQLACAGRSRLWSSRLRLIDGTNPRAAAEAVSAADLFLFTSTVECAPLVILEAMAAGTPWVSYDVGNVSELPGGVVVPDFSRLVKVAGMILDGSQAELSRKGHDAWLARHQWEVIVEQYESVFAEVVSETQRTVRGPC